MATILKQLEVSLVRENILNYLSLKDFLNLKTVCRKWDSLFKVFDLREHLHIGNSPTQEKTEKSQKLQRGLSVALIKASQWGDLETVRELLSLPETDINAEKWSQTALRWACQYNQVEIVEELVSRPELDVNVRAGDGSTALVEAAWRNHWEIVQLLLSRPELDVNIQDRYGNTALKQAYRCRCPETVQLLLSDTRIIRCWYY